MSIVLYRLTDRHVLAELLSTNEEGRSELRTWAIYPDGHMDTLEISNVPQGTGLNEWQDPLSAVAPLFIVESPHLPIPMPAQEVRT